MSLGPSIACLCTFSDLEGTGGFVRITFFDSSSAFNAIQSRLLSEGLQVVLLNASSVSWITDYLAGRPQFVRVRRVLFDTVVSDTGAVPSPFLVHHRPPAQLGVPPSAEVL